MINHLRRLATHTVIYGVGDAIARVAALLLLPLYTHILTPVDYGKLAIVTVISTVATLILDLGQRSAFFRFYFQSDETSRRRKLTGTVLITLLLSSAVILSPVILFFSRLPGFSGISRPLAHLIQVALVSTFFDIGSVIPFATFRAEQRATQYAALSVVRFFTSLSLNVVAVVVLRWGVEGVIYANLLTSMLFFLICLVLTARAIEWTIDWRLLKQLLRFGLPLIPTGLAAWALNLSDRFFLERYAGLTQVGVYAVSYSIVGALNMFMNWFNLAYAPYCYSIANQPDARAVYSRVVTYAMTLFTFVGLGLSLFAQEMLVLLTPPTYHAAARIVPLIILAYLFFELYYLLSFGLDLTGKTGFSPIIIGVGAVINLLLNIFLIPRWGMLGAAVATVLGYMLLPLVEYPIVRRLYHVPYEWPRLGKLFLVSTGIYLVGAALKAGLFWFDLIVGVLLILIWAAVLYFLKFIDKREMSALQALLNKIRTTIHGRLGSVTP